MLFSLLLNRATDNMLPCGTAYSWFFGSERIDPMQTREHLPERKFLMISDSLPFIPRSYGSRMIPYFQLFSKSKNTVAIHTLFRNAPLIQLSKQTMWSTVMFFLLKPYCKPIINFLDSKYQTKRLFTIFCQGFT